jgi:hypothetical protein
MKRTFMATSPRTMKVWYFHGNPPYVFAFRFLIRAASTGIDDARRVLAFLILPQKLLHLHPRLFQNGSERTFGHIPRMIGDRGIAVGRGVVPNFVRTGSLSVKLKS